MALAKVIINNAAATLISANLTKEGERAVDQMRITIPKSTTDLEEAIETFSLKVSTSDVKGLVFGISTTAVTPPHAADSQPLFQYQSGKRWRNGRDERSTHHVI